MYIGELAKRTGATPKAIRLYESLGLLGSPRLHQLTQVPEVPILGLLL